MTANGDNSPVLAFWQKGVGRTAALALDASGGFGQNSDFADIVLSSARWIMGSNVNDSFQVQSQTDGNYARISMEVSDEERAAMGQARLVMFAPDGSTVERPLQWDTWNRLSADVRLNQGGAWRGLIQMGDKSYRVGPVSMPVSPEFAYRGEAGRGRETLMQMAAMTGGKELIDIAPLFERKNVTVSTEPMTLPLLILLALALIGEIAEARFGLLQRLMAKLKGGALGGVLATAGAGVSDAVQKGVAGRRGRARRRVKTERAETETAVKGGDTVGRGAVRGDGVSGVTSEGLGQSGKMGDGVGKGGDKAGKAGDGAAKAGDDSMDFLSKAKDSARREMKK